MDVRAPPGTARQGYFPLLFCLVLLATAFLATPIHPVAFRGYLKSSVRLLKPQPTYSEPSISLALPSTLKKLYINIGPNTSPVLPSAHDSSSGVLAIEPNTAIAHHLREAFQKRRFPFRFFVINCALGRTPPGRFSTFNYYNAFGASSSLARAVEGRDGRPPSFADRKQNSPNDAFGPGPAGVDFVPVLSLEALLKSIPENVTIPFMQIDAQGLDFDIVKSASQASLRRVKRIMTETYLPGIEGARYQGVKNDLIRDWITHMKNMGFRLTNPTDARMREYDAVWIRQDL